jgi:hypothetical protein
VVGIVQHPCLDTGKQLLAHAGYTDRKSASCCAVVTEHMHPGGSLVPCCLALQPIGVSTHSGLRIEQRTLKGVDSFGMLCSAHDCGWTDEPDNVLIRLRDEDGLSVGDEAPAQAPEVSHGEQQAARTTSIACTMRHSQSRSAAFIGWSQPNVRACRVPLAQNAN